MFVLDSHCDTPSEICRGRDLRLDNASGHLDIPKLVNSGVDGAFFALYVPASLDSEPEEAFRHADKLLVNLVKVVESNGDRLAFARSETQARENKSQGLFSVFIGLENGSPIGKSLERIRWFHDRGVRYITLCHSENNEICDSCAPKQKRWGGLSPFGREVVAEMNRLGMLVDVSHVSDDTFYDVLECSAKPVVATHSCCRALSDHPRNMTDEMIRDLAAKGGVIQINFYPVFLDVTLPENEVPFTRIADHIDHVVNLVGVDHVGIGSDFDGIDSVPVGLEDVSRMPVLFDELRRRGYSDSDLCKIAGGNFFRCLE